VGYDGPPDERVELESAVLSDYFATNATTSTAPECRAGQISFWTGVVMADLLARSESVVLTDNNLPFDHTTEITDERRNGHRLCGPGG